MTFPRFRTTLLIRVMFACGFALLASTNSAKANADLESEPDFNGVADYYADCFHGKRTASGAGYDKSKLTAAHRTLPFGTRVRLVNKRTGKSCIVVINDRGPFTKNRIIDVSREAARQLGLFSGHRGVNGYIVASGQKIASN